MTKLLDRMKWINVATESVVGFEMLEWQRYLTLEGKRAYDTGGLCGTCGFLFERLDGANQGVSPEEMTAILREGINELDSHVQQVAKMCPEGGFEVILLKVQPKLVQLGTDEDYFQNELVASWGIDGFWGLPHHPKVPYYRSMTKKIDDGTKLFEFIVPMYPSGWLEEETVEAYCERILAGERPTAMAISIFDVKELMGVEGSRFPEFPTHWCLAHFLLDGHHKMFAASKLGKPITLLSFVSTNHCVATKEEIEAMFHHFSE